MVILDTALQRRADAGTPIRVGIVGAGVIGTGMTRQILHNLPGMTVAAISNRTLSRARDAYVDAGRDDVVEAATTAQMEDAIARGQAVITEDPDVLCAADNVDVVIEATGTIAFAARVAMRAMEHGTPVVLMNPEVDATLGPLLKVYADRHGVVVTNADGDQPGVAMNLFRYVKGIGYDPVLIGNIKGMLDHYRTPATQKAFAEKYDQDVHMVTSFADGTKLAMEQAVMANATGFRVSTRGMHGPACAHVTEAPDLFDLDELLDGGRTDYVLGAEPGPGVFVLAYNDDPVFRDYGQVYKMGEGPLYTFYLPYHIPHLEGPLSAARAVLFGDATIEPQGAPVCEVVTVAKTDLQAGDTLDGLGGFLSYGVIDNTDVCRRDSLLPMGLSGGLTLVRDVPKDRPVTFDDVRPVAGRVEDTLWDEQMAHFGLATRPPRASDSLASTGATALGSR